MKTLIEEFGHTSIALAIAAIMLSSLLIGIVLPEMQFYIMTSVPEDMEVSNDSFIENLNRENPVVTAPSITVNGNVSQIDFDDYISDKTIKAVNADGLDISSNIVIKTNDKSIIKFYDESNKVLKVSDIVSGNYNFIVSVVDYTDEKYYGKTTEVNFTVSVSTP